MTLLVISSFCLSQKFYIIILLCYYLYKAIYMNKKLNEILEKYDENYIIEKNPIIGEILEEKKHFFLINFEDEVYNINLDYVIRNKEREILFVILDKNDKNLELIDHFLNKNGIKTINKDNLELIEASLNNPKND